MTVTAAASDGSDNNTGVMVALRVPDPERYAVPGGLPAEDLHVTLAYLGKAADLPPDAAEAILAAARAACQGATRIRATFPTEYGTFENPDEVPFWGKPEGPQIFTFRDALMSQLQARGVADLVYTNHPFNPHVTLKYLDGESERIPEGFTPREPQTIHFTEVLVSIGDDEQVIPLSDPDPQPVAASAKPRPVRINAQTEQSLRRMVELHNRTFRGALASVEMAKAVYARGASTASAQAGSSRHALGITRVGTFLDMLGSNDQSCPDKDLFPSRAPRTPLWDAAVTASAIGADEIYQRLALAAVTPITDPTRVFHLNRALALTASAAPAVRTQLEDRLRNLVADGNSSMARSLRARRQLRDRYGRWIEMGGGVRFKVRSPGAPGGGTWYHGRVEGIDVPNGRVDVRLQDGRLVKVPNDKLEQPKALLNLPGQPVNPATDEANLPDDAPEIARLDETDAPTNSAAGDAAGAQEMADALDEAAREFAARVAEDSSEGRARGQATEAVARIANEHVEGRMTREDALAQLADVANFVEARGANSEGLSDDEREAFRAYAEDIQDVIAASQESDAQVARLPDSPAPTAPNPAAPAPNAEVEELKADLDDFDRSYGDLVAFGDTPISDHLSAVKADLDAGQYEAALQKLGDLESDLSGPNAESELHRQAGVGISEITYRVGLLTEEDTAAPAPAPASDAPEEPTAEANAPDGPQLPDAEEFGNLAEQVAQMADDYESKPEVQDRLNAIANVIANVGNDLYNGELAGDEAVEALRQVDSAINAMFDENDPVANEIDQDVEDELNALAGDIGDLRQQIQDWVDAPDVPEGGPAQQSDPEAPDVNEDVLTEGELSGDSAHQDGMVPELSDAQAEAVGNYISEGFRQINTYLRENNGEVDPDALAENVPVGEIVDEVDSAMNQSRVDEPFVAYRHVNPDFLGQFDVGDVIGDEAYVSLTSDPGFISNPGEGIEVHVPAGSRALSIGRLSGEDGRILEDDPEREILLPRGTALRVTGRDENGRLIADAVTPGFEEPTANVQPADVAEGPAAETPDPSGTDQHKQMVADALIPIIDSIENNGFDVDQVAEVMGEKVVDSFADVNDAKDAVDDGDPIPGARELRQALVDYRDDLRDADPTDGNGALKDEMIREAEAWIQGIDAALAEPEPGQADPWDGGQLGPDAQARADRAAEVLNAWDEFRSNNESLLGDEAVGPDGESALEMLDSIRQGLENDQHTEAEAAGLIDNIASEVSNEDLVPGLKAIADGLRGDQGGGQAPEQRPVDGIERGVSGFDDPELQNAGEIGPESVPANEAVGTALMQHADGDLSDAEAVNQLREIASELQDGGADPAAVARVNAYADYLENPPAADAPAPGDGPDPWAAAPESGGDIPFAPERAVEAADLARDALHEVNNHVANMALAELEDFMADQADDPEGFDYRDVGAQLAGHAQTMALLAEGAEDPNEIAMLRQAEDALMNAANVFADAPEQPSGADAWIGQDQDGHDVNQGDWIQLPDGRRGFVDGLDDEGQIEISVEGGDSLYLDREDVASLRLLSDTEVENLDIEAMRRGNQDAPAPTPTPTPETPAEATPDANDAPVDQFGAPAAPGFELVEERDVQGQPVQVWKSAGADLGEGVTVEVGRARNGNPVYFVYPNSGLRRMGGRNASSWDEVAQAAEEMRAAEAGRRDAERVRRDERQGQRAAQDAAEAQRIAEARAAHEDRVARNVDDFDRPLPEGWERDITAEGETVYRAPGRYLAMNHPDGDGGFVLLRRESFGFAQVGEYANWDDMTAGMNADRGERAQVHRDELARAVDGVFDGETISQILTNPDAAAVRAAIEQDPGYQRMRDRFEQNRGAEIRQRGQREDDQRFQDLQGLIANLDDLAPAAPERPEPAPAGNQPDAWDLGGDAQQLLVDLPIEPDESAAVLDFVIGMPDTIEALPEDDRQRIADEIRGALNSSAAQGLDEESRRFLNEIADGISPAAEGSPDGGAPAAPETPSPDGAPSIDDLVQRERDLEEQRRQARRAGNMDQVRELGRQLNEVDRQIQDHPDYEDRAGNPPTESRAPVPEDGPLPGPDAEPPAPNAEDAVPAEEAPPAPEPAPVPAGPRPPRPGGAPAGQETRYHRDGVIVDRNGRAVYRGLRVRGLRDGQEGVIVAVQQQPPYVRIELDDGRRLVRAGRQVVDVDPRQGEAFAEVRQPGQVNVPPAAPNAPAAPAAPADPAQHIQALNEIRAEIPRLQRQAGNRDVWRAGFGIAGDVIPALQAGNIDVAKQLLDRDIDRLQRGGRPELADRLAAVRQALDVPQAAGIDPEELGNRIDAVVEMHRQGAQRGFPLIPEVGEARRNMEQAVSLARGGDAAGAKDMVERAIANYDRALAGQLGNNAALRADVERRRAGAKEIHDAINANNVPGRAAAPAAPNAGRNAPVMPGDFLEDPFSGAPQMHRAADPNTPGVRDPRIENPDAVSVTALNPEAQQRDFAAWGARGAEIAGAARSRPSAKSVLQLQGQEFQDAVKAIFGADDNNVVFGDGFQLKMQYATKSGNQISTEFSIIDANGNVTGRTRRVLYFDSRGNPTYAYNSFMKNDSKGGGFANGFNRYMENWYVANGFSSVQVSAAGDNGYTGGFVWAVNGFGWNSQSNEPKGMAGRLLDRLYRATQAGSPERAQVNELIKRNKAGDVPTPMELALVGWRPGMGGRDRWLGKNVMEKQSWGGIKELTPDSLNGHQRAGYEAAKRSGDRARQGAAVVQASGPLGGQVGTAQDLKLRPAQREELRQAIINGQSIAKLSPGVKREVLRWTNERLRKGKHTDYPEMADDLMNLRRAALSEVRAEYPEASSIGVGEELRDLSVADLRANQVPGWNFRNLADAGEAGINGQVGAMYQATHIPTGQVFYVKKDVYGDRIAGRPGVSRDAEEDVNTLFQRMGLAGVSKGVPSRADRSIVIHQAVGDNLPVSAAPKNAGKYRSDDRANAFENLANVEDAFAMMLADAAGGNTDRHQGNYQLGKDDNSQWWVFPIDHGLFGGGQGWQWADATTPADFIKSQLMNSRSEIYSKGVRAAAKGMGPEAVKSLLTSQISRYRSAIGQGGFADPEFQAKMDAKFDWMQNHLDEMVRAIIGRR